MENVPVKVEGLTRYYGKRRGVVDRRGAIAYSQDAHRVRDRSNPGALGATCAGSS